MRWKRRCFGTEWYIKEACLLFQPKKGIQNLHNAADVQVLPLTTSSLRCTTKNFVHLLAQDLPEVLLAKQTCVLLQPASAGLMVQGPNQGIWTSGQMFLLPAFTQRITGGTPNVSHEVPLKSNSGSLGINFNSKSLNLLFSFFVTVSLLSHCFFLGSLLK